MNNKLTTLGGTASDVTVGKIAHGLMRMTWTAVPTPDEVAFEAIKAGVDTLPPDAKMILNSGEFYATDGSTANLDLLARFYEKYPDYAKKTFLSVKGKVGSSPENLRRSVDLINEKLRGTKKLDLYESARVDPSLPIEEAIQTLVVLKNEGKFGHIGMSESKAETLRRANAVHPIAAVEIEVSPWSYESETKKVIATAKELNIAVVAYSPLGQGIFAGTISKPEDLSADDYRRKFTRFKEENINHNLTIVNALSQLANKKGVTPAQLSISWVSSLGQHVIPLHGSSQCKRTLENLGASDIKLSAEELKEIHEILVNHEVKGDRYFGDDKAAMLWG
ncbi:hypothetical protein PILCRDRAFT_3825 [Piloderma croceum F 1598]|uniref:NADP-dependent oxidoreductase domain-containing protein n=1 Tax=Piloderma croceum (strain F 1598) TaxID=765440 RepID=A0A0C3BLK5_PILCF|nr:hypothetical protein PILCRDRAFT_3825 [Piloderma croceum F 1598]